MAKALQCPNCGTKKRIDALAGGDTFQCEGCGQVTKVPPGLHDDHRRGNARRSKPAPVVAAAGTNDGAPPAPPKRRAGSVPAAGAVAPAVSVGGTAAIPASPAGAPRGGGGVAVAAPPRGSGARRGAPLGVDAGADTPRQVKLHWRVLTWLVALPIALAVVGIPARGAGYLNSQRLLDVIVDNGLTRFVPILVIVVLWAVTTALLVTAILAIGQRLAARRPRRA